MVKSKDKINTNNISMVITSHEAIIENFGFACVGLFRQGLRKKMIFCINFSGFRKNAERIFDFLRVTHFCSQFCTDF